MNNTEKAGLCVLIVVVMTLITGAIVSAVTRKGTCPDCQSTYNLNSFSYYHEVIKDKEESND